MSMNSLLETGAISEVEMTATGLDIHNSLVRKRTLNHLAQQTKWLNWIVSTYLYNAFDCIFYVRTRFRLNPHYLAVA